MEEAVSGAVWLRYFEKYLSTAAWFETFAEIMERPALTTSGSSLRIACSRRTDDLDVSIGVTTAIGLPSGRAITTGTSRSASLIWASTEIFIPYPCK